MPHATSDNAEPRLPLRAKPSSKKSTANRSIHGLSEQLEEYKTLYATSQLSQTITTRLQAMMKTAPTPITRILSLGLGSLVVTKGQTRRLKQLALLLALRASIQEISGTCIQLYAQDPTFTRHDETLLRSLNIHILHTPSGSSLGEAASILNPSTLVYSPFLTLEAYEQLLVAAKTPVRYLLGDDFDALLEKWPRRSAERTQVERVVKTGLARHYRRRGVAGKGFWSDDDAAFPMALYEWVAGEKSTSRIRNR
ncbi:hypothetical protein ACJQWK_08226 [Exserohilum turcicum]|uniref:SRR1-like domain-containing protein n=1 Tax=Exserohilum turcicum (strain 28A) TaxID=671987 RepID=R0ITA3_EXST2|nr:uncharacterized protein SETTUDRAFT_39016 [Exserohilum turcica Et28A]EOA87886.1 hypothetical protein SETTUDRAFT_39016 [Exserohilum turcica Et28A]